LCIDGAPSPQRPPLRSRQGPPGTIVLAAGARGVRQIARDRYQIPWFRRAGRLTAMSATTITFHIGQRVVCVDTSPNRRCSAAKLLTRGKIYTIRAIDSNPGWQAPGWGVHLEGIWIIHPDVGCEWPIHPRRFRPIVDRPTDIEIFRKLLRPKTPRQLRLP